MGLGYLGGMMNEEVELAGQRREGFTSRIYQRKPLARRIILDGDFYKFPLKPRVFEDYSAHSFSGYFWKSLGTGKLSLRANGNARWKYEQIPMKRTVCMSPHLSTIVFNISIIAR